MRSRYSAPRFLTGFMLVGLISLSACGGKGPAEDSAEAEASAAPATEAAPPTAVVRMEPTPTATVDPAAEPMAPVASEALPGLVVPAAATLIELVEPTEDRDGRADYAIEDVDEEALYDWFVTQWPKLDWGEPEDRDGSLIFLHRTELSQRFAELGQKRTATIVFGLVDGADFSILAEAPK
jgi:predicted small lipoprotein YifL